jgi:hypothetical protein
MIKTEIVVKKKTKNKRKKVFIEYKSIVNKIENQRRS